MEKIKDFLIHYKGAIIGGIVAILLLLLKIYKIIVYGLIIVAGMAIGYYIQCNKEIVKEKIKNFVDKL